MGVKGEEPVLAAPEFLHAGEALKDKAHVAFKGAVDFIEEIHEFLRLPGLLYFDDAAGKFGVRFLIKLEKEAGAAPLAVGEAVQDDEAGICG